MPCNFDEKLLHLFVDNELDSGEKERVAGHIENCPDCSMRLRIISATKNTLRIASQTQSAPLSLKARIQANLNNEQTVNSLRLSFADRFRLIFGGFRPAQATVIGAILILVISLVFIPGKSPASNLADTLTMEYIRHHGLIDDTGIESNKSQEVADFLLRQVGQPLDFPECIDSDLCVAGGCLEKFANLPIAHIIYKGGKTCCSLFVVPLTDSSAVLPNILTANADTFQVGQCNRSNYICWHRDRQLFILVGCCPQDKLLNLARASI
jgi:hypothetical protein